jgi:hypothetical protein
MTALSRLPKSQHSAVVRPLASRDPAGPSLGPRPVARLPELFPAFLEAARRLDLAHVSLMFQPEQNLVGVLTAAVREGRQAPRFETVWLSTISQLAAAIKAEELRGRLRGFYVEKVEHGRTNEFDHMTDDELRQFHEVCKYTSPM